YLLNDLRDREIDASGSLSKRRFPRSLVHSPHALQAASVSILVRWVFALLLVGCIFPVEQWRWVWHLAFLSAVFLIDTLYETLRNRCILAATTQSQRTLGIWTAAVIGVVGFGYGLRAAVGVWLAGLQTVVPLALAFVGASLFGSAFVSLTWALEATRAKE